MPVANSYDNYKSTMSSVATEPLVQQQTFTAGSGPRVWSMIIANVCEEMPKLSKNFPIPSMAEVVQYLGCPGLS
jgi:hypothetical protein